MHFSTRITNWYQKNKRDFPWRETKDPYKIWLSEIILQQTKTAQGLPYYISFTKKFPNIKKLANASEETILKLWQGLGYYSRARNLHAASKHIMTSLNGIFPTNYNDLLQLKGVGDYTASAIASIAFNEKCAVVDGNVYRVLSRYYGIATPINSSKGNKDFKVLATQLLPKKDFGTHNQALMDFGAMVCTPKKPSCPTCIFNNNCAALADNKVAVLPIKTSKTKIRNRFFNYIVFVTEDNKTKIEKRTKNGIWKNLYQFPLIESDKELSINKLAKNELFVEITNPTTVKNIQLFNSKKIVHKLSHQHLHTRFWVVSILNLKKSISFSDLKNHPFPTLINNFIIDFSK